MEGSNLVFYFALGASGTDKIIYDRISDSQKQSDYSSVIHYLFANLIVCKPSIDNIG